VRGIIAWGLGRPPPRASKVKDRRSWKFRAQWRNDVPEFRWRRQKCERDVAYKSKGKKGASLKRRPKRQAETRRPLSQSADQRVRRPPSLLGEKKGCRSKTHEGKIGSLRGTARGLSPQEELGLRRASLRVNGGQQGVKGLLGHPLSRWEISCNETSGRARARAIAPAPTLERKER